MRRSLSRPAPSNDGKRHRLLLFLLVVPLLLVIGSTTTLSNTASADSFSFIATDDAHVREDAASTNFGTTPQLNLRAASFSSSRARIMFHFGWLSVVPSDETIVNASLRLKAQSPTTIGTEDICVQQRGPSTFDELTITYVTQGGFIATPEACITVTPSSTVGFYEWDVTALITEQHSFQDDDGLRMIWDDESTGSFWTFFSKDAAIPVTDKPALFITTQGDVDFEVFIDGQLAVIAVELNSSHDFAALVENTGNRIIDEVELTLFNETDTTITTGVVQNLPIGETSDTTVLRAAAADIPSTTGDFAWGINGTFTNGTATPTDDIIRFFNFTLRVVSEGALIFSFRIVNVDLFDDVLGKGGVTTMEVDILNSGTTDLFVNIFFTVNPTITISPDRLTPDVISPGTTVRFDFAVFVGEVGTFPITVRVEPTDAGGANLGPIQNFELTIRVSEVPGVITQDPDDLGPNDAILQGSITSLGEFRSALVFFIIWKTDEVEACTSIPTANCARTPPFGTTVTFVSSFRLFVENLVADTNYSYEFRLQFPGGEALGGVVNFRTPEGFDDPLTAMRNGIGQLLGLDAFTMGAILGTFLLFGTLVLVSLIGGEPNPIILGVAGIAAAGVNLMLGWWPDWLFIILAIIVAAIILRMLPFGGEGAV